MSKKILAMILGLVMILSLCPATVFGAQPTAALTMDETNGPNPSSGSVTGTITQYGKNTDDFEHLTPSATTFNVYPDAGRNQTSNVFVPALTQNTQRDFTVIEATGKDGKTSKMLKMDATYDEARLYVWKLPLPAGQITRFAFDIYFETFDTSGTGDYPVCFNGLISDGVTYGRLKSFIKEKTWYRYVVEIDANQKSRTAFLDTDGNIVYCQATRASSSGSGYTNGWAVTNGASNTWINNYREPTVDISSNNKSVMYIDNAEISAYQASAFAPSLVSSSLANNAKNVSTATKEVTVTFDQPLTAAKATLTPAGGTAVDCTATFVSGVGQKEHTYIITLPALAAETDYTLALTGFSNKSLTCADTIAFKTDEADIAVDRETFEADTNPDVTGSKNKYASRLAVLKKEGYYDLKTELVTGYEVGTQALKLSYGETQSYPTHLITTKSYGLPVYDDDGVNKKGSLVVTYRVKVENKGTNPLIKLGHPDDSGSHAKISMGSNSLIIGNAYDASATYRTVLENHWYNVVWVMDETGSRFSFIDAEGADKGTVVYSRNKAWGDTGINSEVGNGGSRQIYPAYMHHLTGSDKINIGTAVVIDDFAVWQVRTDRAKHALTATGNDLGDGKFTITGNQPVLGTPDMLKLTDTDTDKASYWIPEIRYTDFCTMEVDYKNVDYLTNYKADFSGLKAASGAPIAAGGTNYVTFSKDEVSEDMAVFGDITVNGLTEGSKVSFDLYSETAQTPTVVAAFYDRSYPAKLSAVEIAENLSLDAGVNKNKEITLSKTIDADYVRLYAWDGASTMVPLMDAYKTVTPKESLKVLMIGNSLSEDAGRFFEDVAEAGGLTLDLTIKGVGGSELSHHSNNLKREIGYGLDKDFDNKYQAYIDMVREESIDRPLYFRMKTGETTVSPGSTGYNKDFLLVKALMDDEYDVISLQQFSSGYSDVGMKEPLEYLTETIRKFQPNAEIMIYQAWGGYSGRLDYFKSNIEPLCDKYSNQIPATVSNITAHGDDIEIIPSGHAFYLAEIFSDWGGNDYRNGDGNTNAGTQDSLSTTDSFNVASGLYRDFNHASYYGCYLTNAVWYEMLTGKQAPFVDSTGNAIIKKPSGYLAADTENANQIVDISDAEHLERLEYLSDIAHQVCKEQRAK